MTGKAVQSKAVRSKTLQRTLLVVLLLAVAHAIKPFSLRNLTLQALHSAPSFSFVLPGSLRGGVEDANRLALALGRGWHLFETRREPSVEADWPVADGEVVARSSAQPEVGSGCEQVAPPKPRRAARLAPAVARQPVVSDLQSERRAAEARESVRGLIASNMLRAVDESRAVELPDLKTFTPLALPPPVRPRFSQCESGELKQTAQRAARGPGAVAELRQTQDEAPRASSPAGRPARVAALQRRVQSFRTLLSSAGARRVLLVNCSTTFTTQSGLQVNFRCS
jgi:hypothetical protein